MTTTEPLPNHPPPYGGPLPRQPPTIAAPEVPTSVSNPQADPGTGRPAAGGPSVARGHLRRLWRGHDSDPAWARPCLWLLLAATGALYLWDLSASGWANSFYSAAAQAGSASWKAFLFGSSDAANSITVDKPPASLWPMALSVRIFSLSSWSILVPQALMGVATVGVLYTAVRRHFGAVAGLLAGLAMALTPVAALMFRYNNPDALLTLLLVGSAYTALRAIESGRTRWFLATGALIGFGFLTKQLQVLLVVPGFAVVGLIAGAGGIWPRVRGLLWSGAAMVVSAGWWVAIVELVPESWRPYIGGSQTNSFLELTFGYNGFGRITGNEVGSVGGGGPPGGGGGGMWGETGWSRMFDGATGGQIAWLIPAALVLGAACLWWTRSKPRTDLERASLLVWGSWLVGTALVFSFMGGIFHEYYTVALAPPIAALVGIGALTLWKERHRSSAMVVAAVATAATGWLSVELLSRAEGWNEWLQPLVASVSAAVALGFVLLAIARSSGARVPGGVVAGLGIAALLVVLAGPTAWSLETVTSAENGGIVFAGPQVQGAMGGPGGPGGPGGAAPGGPAASGAMPTPGAPIVPGGPGAPVGPDGTGNFPGGPGVQQAPDGGAGPGAPLGPPTAGVPQGPPQGATGGLPGAPGGGRGQDGGPGPGGGPGQGGGPGGLLNAMEPSEELRDALVEDAEAYEWIAAAVGANNAAGYQLATELPVMPLGGFNGSDPSPTLEEFEEMVDEGRIHWFIAGDGFGAQRGGSNASSEISTWVEENFEATTIDGTTLYDLSDPVTG